MNQNGKHFNLNLAMNRSILVRRVVLRRIE